MANEHGVDKEAVTIDDVSYSSGSKKGDGFVCDIAAIKFNAIIDGKVFEKNYIAKFCSEKQREYMARKVKIYIRIMCTFYSWSSLGKRDEN